MSPPSSGEVTRLLKEIQGGNERAKEDLFGLVFGELHGLAESLMRKERRGHTLQPTALVNEAVCKLLDNNVFANAKTRAYFFGAVANAMRQILIAHARKRNASKGPGRWVQTPFDDILAYYEQRKIDVSDLNESLEKLKALSPRQYEVVNLRYFGGREMREIADMLGVALATVENDHRAAKAFLRGQLDEGE
jgi:RNA polymerase sigma factor (TIGR02999 family)